MQSKFLDKLVRLGRLTPSAIADLTAATVAATRVPANRDLIREGDRPGPMFIVLEGWAYRYKILPTGTRQVLAYLMPGDSCDLHIGLLAEMDHSIQTITPAVVATIERADVDTMLAAHRCIAEAMYISQLIDEGTMRAWITSMGRRTSLERVAHLMCELYVRAHNIGLFNTTSLTLPLSQSLLADSLGMTPVHLNRVLRELRESGAMTFSRGSLLISDPAKLVTLAGFDENYLHRRIRSAA